MRVTAASKTDLAWLEAKTSATLTRHARGVCARDEQGRPRGVVAYDLWTPESAHVHMALEAPIVARRLLGPALSYPFREVGLSRLLGLVPAENRRSLRVARHAGFREVHRIRDGWRMGVDLVLLELTRTEWEDRHGSIRTAAA